MSEVKQKVYEILIDKLGVEGHEITPEASLYNDLGTDSLDNVEICMEFEKEYNIVITDDAWEQVSTVQDVINLLEATVK